MHLIARLIHFAQPLTLIYPRVYMRPSSRNEAITGDGRASNTHTHTHAASVSLVICSRINHNRSHPSPILARLLLRQVRGHRPAGERQGQENAQAPHHLQFPAAPATQPAVSAHPVPGAARTRRTGRQSRPHADAGKSKRFPTLSPNINMYTHTTCVN